MDALGTVALLAAGWQMVGPFGGSATAIAIDAHNPKHLLAGSRSTMVYKTEDAGANWRLIGLSKRFPGTVTSLIIDPADSRHYLAAANDTGSPFAGVYESRDGGATWKQSPDLAGTSVDALALDPADSKRVAAGTKKGVWLSTDGGARWKRISAPDHMELLAVTAVTFHPSRPQTIFAGTTHLPWKTTDGGKTWRSIHSGLIDDSDVFSIYVNPKKPDQVFASACSGIYSSRTGGETWRKFPGIPGTLRRTKVIRQDPGNPEILYAGTTLGLLKTVDGGDTWRQVTQVPVNSMVLDPSDPKTIYLATETGGVVRSTDRGSNFETLVRGFVNRRVGRLALSGETLFATSPDGVFASPDRGGNWKRVAGPADFEEQKPQALAGHPAYPGLLFAGAGRRLLRSKDSGATWTAISLGTKRPAIQALEIVRAAKGATVLAGTSDGLWRSLDGGTTWTEAILEGKRWLSIYSVVADRGGARILVRTSGGIFRSQDGGMRWFWMDAPGPNSDIYDVALPPATESPVLAATTNGLYRHGPEGWTPQPGGLPNGTVSAVQYHPARKGEVYAVQFGRVFQSVDGGATWGPLESQAGTDVSIRQLWFPLDESEELFAITPDLGILLRVLRPLLKAPGSGPKIRVD